jgi:hypothetical protein
LIFAVNTKVSAQALDQHITVTQPITPLSCASGTPLPLHPFAGISYTYTMTAPGAEAADEWTWWVTKDPNFIPSAGTNNSATMLTVSTGQLVAASGHYGTATAAANSIDITWSPEILSATEYQGDVTAAGTAAAPSPTFVVGYATGVNCADNIQVFEINPQDNFTIDIANVDPATETTMAWATPTEQCVDLVNSAVYDNTTKELTMDYGTNTLYFEVVAANFNTDWTPTFRLVSGLQLGQTAAVTLHSSMADAQGDANVIETLNWDDTSVGSDFITTTRFTATDPTEVAAGVSLFVKVVISNGTYESLVANPFVLAVDAQDGTGAGIWDMEDDDCTALTDAADQVDEATHTVNPRPELVMDGAAMSEPSTVTPEDVITKTP